MGWSVLAGHCLGALVSEGGLVAERMIAYAEERWERETDRQTALPFGNIGCERDVGVL